MKMEYDSQPVSTIPDRRQGVPPLLIRGSIIGNEFEVMGKGERL